ncbi:hypothetical protein WKH10_05560 [Pantoea agglomerans]|uniref:hypothetical protein n=1 Tax=Enterobacter agglomerans TaxID=549 RepID=UPI003C7CDF3F
MVSIWATILVAILSSGSALLAGIMTNRATERRLALQSSLDSKREIRKSKLLKAEEIYASLLTFKMMIFKIHMDWVAVCKSELTVDEMFKKLDKHSEDNDAIVLNAKLGIYFPSLKEKFNEARMQLKPANKCYFKLRDTKTPASEKLSFVNIILDAGSKFDAEIDNLLLQLSRDVNSDL